MSKKVNKQRKTRERGLNVKITEETKKSKSDTVRVNNNFDKKRTSKKPTKKSVEKALEKSAKSAAKKPVEKEPILKKDDSKKVSEEKSQIVTVKKTTSKKPSAAEAPKQSLSDTKAPKQSISDTKAPKHDASVAKDIKQDASDAKAAKQNISNTKAAKQNISDAKAVKPKTVVSEKNQKPEESQQVEPIIKLPASFSRNGDFNDTFNDISWAQPEETFKLDTSAVERGYSRIVTRDVERIMPEPSPQAEQPQTKQPRVKQPESRLQPAQPQEPQTQPTTVDDVVFNIGSNNRDIQQFGLSTSIAAPEPQTIPKKSSAKLLKEQEIKKAINTASKIPSGKQKRSRFSIQKIGWPRMILAISCMATAVFAIAYFINLSASDMSIKVAAIQSGIEASYPSYTPRGFALSDVTSANGKIAMVFSGEDGEYVISEENSTWDANALLTNYVKPEYGDEYSVVKEQGLTLYVGSRWQVWTNGGILYKLSVTNGLLTKKQMKTIATSL